MNVKAKAMGSGAEGAQNNLQESYNEVRLFYRLYIYYCIQMHYCLQDMTLEEAETLAISTLKKVHTNNDIFYPY